MDFQPGQTFSFVARNVKGQQVLDQDAAGANALGGSSSSILWEIPRDVKKTQRQIQGRVTIYYASNKTCGHFLTNFPKNYITYFLTPILLHENQKKGMNHNGIMCIMVPVCVSVQCTWSNDSNNNFRYTILPNQTRGVKTVFYELYFIYCIPSQSICVTWNLWDCIHYTYVYRTL